MRKIYNTPKVKIHTCSFGPLLGNGSTGANLYDKDGKYSGSIGNGGGVGEGTTVVPGAKRSYFSSWDGELDE